MRYNEQTGKSILQSFEEFHKKNPLVYDIFKGQVYRAIGKNRTKVSSKAIINWMRWETSLNTDTTETYKINDAFTSHYARLFIKDHPQYSDVFEIRELRDGSEDGKSYKKPNDEYRMSILSKLVKGNSIIHYTGNNTVILCPIGELDFETEKITTVSFNKLVKDKLVTPFYQQQHMHEYRISKQGLKLAKTTKTKQ